MKRAASSGIILAAFICLFQASFIHAQMPKSGSGSPAMEAQIDALLNKLTVAEKIGLLGYDSKPVDRLGIPAYNWWNEALHGVARAGKATVFPQAIALAATFNDGLVQQVGDVISTEARAKYNVAVRQGNRGQYLGLTFWSPNINIFRDPRWGRGQETYGEDPFLTSRIGGAFVRGLQGTNPQYLKVAAGAKHFVAHSGPEASRHSFDARVDEKDLRETYYYAFHHLANQGVEAVMCAYNRINGEPCCTSYGLLTQLLRKEWGFKGHVVTDCWALQDVISGHKLMNDPVTLAAAAVKAGVNLDCSPLLQQKLPEAIRRNLITLAALDSTLRPLLRTQMKLGILGGTPANMPFTKLGAADVHKPAHVQMALETARQCMVLLKNKNNTLPFKASALHSLMVIGPNAGSLSPLLANYHGMSGDMVTFAEGLTEAAGPGVAVQYDQGSDYTDTSHFGGLWAAGMCDATVAVIGLTPVLEGEEGDAFLSKSGGDKANLDLPAPHIELVKRLRAIGKPLVVVVNAGGAVDLSSIEPYADAIILAWYPGEQGGRALADIIFGKISPSGRLPVTFYKSFSDLPAYDSYALQGRTYRYFGGEAQYPFGFGLSYTRFDYAWEQQPRKNYSSNDTLHFSATITNTGDTDGAEVVQAYIQYPGIERMPLRELKGFKRTMVKKNGSQEVRFTIPVSELQKWDLKQNGWKTYAGEYKIILGSHSGDNRLIFPFELR